MVDTITIRLPDGMRPDLHLVAESNNNSVNREVVELIRKAIKRYHSKAEV